MVRRFLKITLRTLVKNSLSTFIKIAGLSVGISGCLLIFLVIQFELSFDTFQQDGDRIYRIYSAFDETNFNPGVPAPLAPMVKNEFTGLDAVSSIETFSAKVEPQKTGEKISFEKEPDLVFVGPEYFDVFNFYEWISGTPSDLKDPFTVVLSQSKVKKYFGIVNSTEAIGKRVTYNDSLFVTVVGVIKDIEENTDFEFGDYLSFSTIDKTWLRKNYQKDAWNHTSSATQCFIKLSRGTTTTAVERLTPLLSKKFDESNGNQHGVAYQLQPLSDIHTNPDIGIFGNYRVPANLETLKKLALIAILLLAIAAINFINLETAQAVKRSKEIGLYKTLGCGRGQLIKYFLLESILVTSIGVLTAIPLTIISLRFFGEFLPTELTFDITNPALILFLLVVIIVVAVLAGLYPAFVLSSFQPVKALKNEIIIGRNSNASLLRKGLIVFQFSVAHVIMIGTLILSWQIKSMLEKDLGFDAQSVTTFYIPWWLNVNRPEVLQNELSQLPEISAITHHDLPPASSGYSRTSFRFPDEKSEPFQVYVREGDTAYFSFYKIPLIAGQLILPNDSSRQILVNEAFCRKVKYQPIDLVGQVIKRGRKGDLTIAGVVKDFHFRSLHHEIEPLYYQFKKDEKGFALRLNHINESADFSESLDKIQAIWKKIYPEAEFKYSFVNDQINNFYKSEKRITKLTNTATILTIFISCLGLLGLAAFTATQRTKEIGIRKVLGASVPNIVGLLSREFMTMVLIAFLVATPLAWYGGNLWLSDYAFRITLGWEIFAIAGGLSFIVAFLTVGFQTLSAALANPVESLRYE